MAVSPHRPVQWFHSNVLVWLWQQLEEAKGFSPWREHHDPLQVGLLPQDPNVSCSYQLNIIETMLLAISANRQLPLYSPIAVIPYPKPLAWKTGLITKASRPFLQVKEHTDDIFEGNSFNIWPAHLASEKTFLKSPPTCLLIHHEISWTAGNKRR